MLLVAFGYSLMLVACCGELVAATLFCIVTFNKSGERREGGFNKDRKFGGKRRES
ncbi:hypothetical protein [Aeromonas sp. 11P]|uniref:hypothetical protein n=1 Tax=Aeromonas sp. 11P TaxID=3452713 RepID=UPI003F7B3149